MVCFRGHEPGKQREFTSSSSPSASPSPTTAQWETQLDTLNTTKMKRDVTETIKDSDHLDWMVGGIDLSLNDDTQKKAAHRWQAQLYGFAEVSNREQFSKLLRDTYQAKPGR